jgi:hypothetical protein
MNMKDFHLYPKTGSFSATFNDFTTESASKIAQFKMVQIKLGGLLHAPKVTAMFHVLFEPSQNAKIHLAAIKRMEHIVTVCLSSL